MFHTRSQMSLSLVRWMSLNDERSTANRSNWPRTVSQRATAPYTSSRMRMTTRLMMAAVVLTVSLTLERVMGFELIARAALVEIRYKITPNTIANVTPIWKTVRMHFIQRVSKHIHVFYLKCRQLSWLHNWKYNQINTSMKAVKNRITY